MKSSKHTGDNASGASLPGHSPRLRYIDVVELSHNEAQGHRPASETRRTPSHSAYSAQPARPGTSHAGLRVQPSITAAPATARPAPVIDHVAAAREAIAQANREASKIGLGPRFFDTLEETRVATPALLSDDARWVFAVRVKREMQGGRAAIIAPESRRRLLGLANRLGLRDFDANLIIAIVQDDARTFPSIIPVPSDATKGPLALVRSAQPESTESSEMFWWNIGAAAGLACLLCFAMVRWLGVV